MEKKLKLLTGVIQNFWNMFKLFIVENFSLV